MSRLQVDGVCAWLQGPTNVVTVGNEPMRCPCCGAWGEVRSRITMHGVNGEKQVGTDCSCPSCSTLTVVWGPVLYPPPADPLEQMIAWNEAMDKKRKRKSGGISQADIRALEATIPPQIDPEQARKMFEPQPGWERVVHAGTGEIRLVPEKRDRFAGIGPGVHLEWRSSGEATRVVIVARDMTADRWQVRPVASDGVLGPVTTLTSEQVEWACSVLGAIPTHEPPAAPRGRTRLKPGVTL